MTHRLRTLGGNRAMRYGTWSTAAGVTSSLACLTLLTSGCSTPPVSDAPAGDTRQTIPTGTTVEPVPTAGATDPGLAGPSEAAAAASLTDGPATGTVVIAYDGLGQADSPFTGTCSRSGTVTTVSGTAGSATVQFTFDPAAVTLTVEDTGLGTSVSQVGAAEFTVTEDRLVLTAALVQEEQRVGSVQADIACGA